MSAGLALVLFVLVGCEGRSGSEEGVGEAEVPMEEVNPAMAAEGEEGEGEGAKAVNTLKAARGRGWRARRGRRAR